MDKNQLNEKLKELTLMLLYLNSWEENEFGMKYRRSWKVMTLIYSMTLRLQVLRFF